jgi:ribosomal protein L12E/L44/L45/RPP1/RPP2
MPGTHADILEFVTQRQEGLTVDTEHAVIHGVRVLGLSSANGRDYLAAAVKAALPLYEGRPTNCDHPTRAGEPTTIARRNGWLAAARQDTDGGMRADWHLIKSHPMTAMILEVAQRNPSLLGLSHNVSGKVRRENGREIVEAIEVVHSVDCVADPATVKGLHEGISLNHLRNRRGTESTMSTTVRQLIESLKDRRPRYAAALREMAEAGIMSGDTAMEAPPESPAGEADHEAALKAGFRAAVMAIMDDDSLDMSAKLKKMRDVLRAEEKLLGGNGEGDKKEGSDMPATEESRKLKLENTGLKLLLEAGVKPNKVIIRALSSCTTEAEMRELIEESRNGTGAAGGPQRPRSAAPPAPAPGNGSRTVQEQRTGAAVEIPTDAKQLGRWLKTAD